MSSEQLNVTVTYLEQTSRPVLRSCPVPNVPMALMRVNNPPIHYYRYLYDLIGSPFNWVSRTMMRDEDLINIITHPRVFIYILYVEGVPAGFAEIDARHPSIPEIKFFGLAHDFIGKGFGRYFLTQVIDLAWMCGAPGEDSQPAPSNSAPAHMPGHESGVKCVRLETCTLDHPAALPLYQKMGFCVIDQRKGTVPRLPGYKMPADMDRT